MKKKFFVSYFLVFFSTFVFSIDFKLMKIFESIESNPIGCFGVLDCFYIENNSLVIVFERQSNRDSVFSINQDGVAEKITYEAIKFKYGETPIFIQNGISYELKYNYSVIFSAKQIDFYNDFIETKFGDNPAPYYMYVMDNNDSIVFNFNTWRLDKTEFYPKSYYNSLSEKKEYTLEQKIKQLKLYPASTEWRNHTAINKKQNRIAVVFDKYNGKNGALVIFEVLYNAVCNDDKVRVRTEPNLNCETICFLNRNDAVKIKDQSDRKFEIDGEKWYWHQVETSDGKTGWVYGKYLDIEN